MPRFKLVNRRARTVVAEFESNFLASALTVAGSHGLQDADLWQENDFLCTLHRNDANSEFWVIEAAH